MRTTSAHHQCSICANIKQASYLGLHDTRCCALHCAEVSQNNVQLLRCTGLIKSFGVFKYNALGIFFRNLRLISILPVDG